MKIERFFYNDNKALLKKIQEQVSGEEASLTEGDKLVKEEQSKRVIQAIFEKCEKQEEKSGRTVNAQKVESFKELKLEAIALAQELGANVTIEWNENEQAIIRLVSNMFIINKDTPAIFKKVLCKLIMTSDHIWIDTKQGEDKALVQMEFWCELSDIVDEI